MSSIDETLAERGSRYGDFVGHADVTQSIKASIVSGENWGTMDDDMKEALDMIAHKIGRIVNGDPNYVDSWTDIIGYARLVEKRLLAEQASAKAAENREAIPKKTDSSDLNEFQEKVKKWIDSYKSVAERTGEAVRAYEAKFKDDRLKADKELADKVRSLSPGVHVIFVDEESGETD